MNENNSHELNRAHEIDIENGGQGLHNGEGDLDAVKNQEKTPDQIERMMSPDEVFDIVKENGIYTNMLAPCLSANIFLDGKILEFFKTPMKPIDLDEKVKDVMQLVLMEISREQNGVVFKADGTLDVGESIKQAALNGMPAIPLLRDTMPEGMADELVQKYYDMNRTGIDAAFAIDSKSDYKGIDDEHLKKILSIGINNTRDAYKLYDDHDKYHKMFGERHHTEEEKKELNGRKAVNNEKIGSLSQEIEEIKEKMKTFSMDSEEYKSLLVQLKEKTLERFRYSRENDGIGSLEDSTMEDIEAKGLLASVRIMKKMGLTKEDYLTTHNRLKELNRGNVDVQKATRQEAANCTVERNYLAEMSQRDAKQMQEYKDAIMSGVISEEDREKYLIASVKNYITYSNIQQAGATDVISPDIVKLNIEQAIDGLVATIPNVKVGKQTIDWERIVRAVNSVPGYDKVTMDNIKHVFALEKGNEIQTEIKEIVKSAELDFLEDKEHDDESFVTEIKEADKELELARYVNYVRRLEEKGIENSAVRIFKLKLEKGDLQNVLERADATYEDSISYTEEIMDNYKRGYAFSKYAKYKKLSPKERSQLSKDEKGAYISSMIAAYDISRDETDISLEMQEAAKDVLGTFLGDVFDEQGYIDDEKLFKKYKKTFGFGSKFALGKENESMDGFWGFHEMMSLTKIQKRVVLNFIDAVNDKEKAKIKDSFITEEEAKKKVDERGVELDVSAITDPQKPRSVEPAKITKQEAEAAMERKGESMRVDDPRIASNETKTPVTPPIDKKLEEQGNKVVAEKINLGGTELAVKKEPGIFAKAWNFIKEKVGGLFGGNTDSSNSDTGNNSTTASGGIVQDDKKIQQVVQQNLDWAQPAVVSVKDAKEKYEKSKEEGSSVEPEEVSK